jgi:hypothetical protein
MPTIPSIPILYNGVRFRSRLEARWAAMFDRLGWEWHYEPIDLLGYIPDFLITRGTWLASDYGELLVECKPFVPGHDIPVDTMNKLAKSGWCGPMLLVGSVVRPDGLMGMQWIPHPRAYEYWSAAFATWHPPIVQPTAPDDVTEYWDIGQSAIIEQRQFRLSMMWHGAGNATQWNPPATRVCTFPGCQSDAHGLYGELHVPKCFAHSKQELPLVDL